MAIFSIRRANLLIARDDWFRLKRSQGFDPKQKDFAEACGFEPSYFSQLVQQHSNIGNKTARKIEENLSLEEGWLDVAHDRISAEDAALAKRIGSLSPAQREELTNYLRYIEEYRSQDDSESGEEPKS